MSVNMKTEQSEISNLKKRVKKQTRTSVTCQPKPISKGPTKVEARTRGERE